MGQNQERSEVRTLVESELKRILGEGSLRFEASHAPYFQLENGRRFQGFSYSHTAGASLLVVAAQEDAAVGVDIEPIGRALVKPEAIAKRIGVPWEGETALLETWVRLEAISKARRCSLWETIASRPDPMDADLFRANGYFIGLSFKSQD
jgi:phosphopantetheinyl transferase